MVSGCLLKFAQQASAGVFVTPLAPHPDAGLVLIVAGDNLRAECENLREPSFPAAAQQTRHPKSFVGHRATVRLVDVDLRRAEGNHLLGQEHGCGGTMDGQGGCEGCHCHQEETSVCLGAGHQGHRAEDGGRGRRVQEDQAEGVGGAHRRLKVVPRLRQPRQQLIYRAPAEIGVRHPFSQVGFDYTQLLYRHQLYCEWVVAKVGYLE